MYLIEAVFCSVGTPDILCLYFGSAIYQLSNLAHVDWRLLAWVLFLKMEKE